MDPWPLRHLVLHTPRLELRPDDDAGLQLGEVLQLVEPVGQRVELASIDVQDAQARELPYDRGDNAQRVSSQAPAEVELPEVGQIRHRVREGGQGVGVHHQHLQRRQFTDPRGQFGQAPVVEDLELCEPRELADAAWNLS